MKDLRALLSKFAENEDEDLTSLIHRKPNGPPAVSLLPSEKAVEGFAVGLDEGLQGEQAKADQATDGASDLFARYANVPALSEPPPMTLGSGRQVIAEGIPEGIPANLANAVAQDTVPPPGGSAVVAEGIDSEPANTFLADEGSQNANQPPPMTLGPAQSPLDKEVSTAQQKYLDARNKPIQKDTKWWKDVGAYIIQGADAFFNPGQGKKIEGWGKIKHDREVRNAEELLGSLQKQRGIETDDAYKQAQTAGAIQRPVIAAREAERKVIKDTRDYEIKTKTLNWKKEDRDRYFELEDVKLAAREKNDQRTYDLAVRKQGEIERNNQAVVASREKIAGLTQEGQNRRRQIAIEATRLNQERQQAFQKGENEKGRALTERLKKLKEEDDGLTGIPATGVPAIDNNIRPGRQIQ